jgi:hypothetical protein
MSENESRKHGKLGIHVEFAPSEFAENIEFANSQNVSLANLIVKLLRESRSKYGVRDSS